MQPKGMTGASARVMVASAVKEEALTLDEVREILDEASEVVIYSHKLEQKSHELEKATTELRAANERLQEVDRLKDDFMSTVTHELRTPLTSIRAFSEILLDDPNIDSAQRTRFVSIIAKEAERLTRLINQVLDLAKIESGSAEWCVTRVDVKEIVSDTLSRMSSVFKEKGIEVLRLDPALSPDALIDVINRWIAAGPVHGRATPAGQTSPRGTGQAGRGMSRSFERTARTPQDPTRHSR